MKNLGVGTLVRTAQGNYGEITGVITRESGTAYEVVCIKDGQASPVCVLSYAEIVASYHKDEPIKARKKRAPKAPVTLPNDQPVVID